MIEHFKPLVICIAAVFCWEMGKWIGRKIWR